MARLALGAVDLLGWFRRWGAPLTAALALVAVGWQLPGGAVCWQEFHGDSRRELIAFLRAQVPADAIIAHDRRVALTRGREAALSLDYELPQPTLQATRLLSDLGTLEEFVERGVHYFVVTGEDYAHIFNAPLTARNAETKARCEAFYGGLFQRGQLLWESQPGRLVYLHPGLRVYRL